MQDDIRWERLHGDEKCNEEWLEMSDVELRFSPESQI